MTRKPVTLKSKRRLSSDIEQCLETILSHNVPRPQTSRLKDGTKVWRLTGAAQALKVDDDGKVFFWRAKSDGGPLEITRENFKYETRPGDCFFFAWEYLVLERGPDIVARELRDALAGKGHAVDVTIGGANARPASIVVRLLSADRRPDVPPNEATLAELASIGEALIIATVTLESLSLRLRSLRAIEMARLSEGTA